MSENLFFYFYQEKLSYNADIKMPYGKKTLWTQSSFCSGFISRIQENLKPDFNRP